MKWHRVEDELPEVRFGRDGGPEPVTVLVYAASIDRHGIAMYWPWKKPHPWEFEANTERFVTTDALAAETFQDGALITHWAKLTRPRGRPGGEP